MKKFARTAIAALAMTMAMSSAAFAGEWKPQATGQWKYTMDTGYDATNRVLPIGSAFYGFDANGNMVTGWQQFDGIWYYFNPTKDGSEGMALTGWQFINGAWYYLSPAMATGWLPIGSSLFFLDASGAMKTGWFDDGLTDYQYYADENGYVKKNTSFSINGVDYRADDQGRIKYRSAATKNTSIPWRDLVKTEGGKRDESNEAVQEDIQEMVDQIKADLVANYYSNVVPATGKTRTRRLESWKKKCHDKLAPKGVAESEINAFISATQWGRYSGGYYTEDLSGYTAKDFEPEYEEEDIDYYEDEWD